MADLTSLANVKQWMGIPVTDTANDALLTRMVTACSAFIASWLGRTLESTSYTDNFIGWGSARFVPANYPVTAIASVVVNGTAVPAAKVFTSSISLRLLDGYSFLDGVLCTVTYTAGYAVVPKDIEQACIEMVALRFEDRKRIGITSKGLAGETISFSQKDMNSFAKSVLSQYLRVFPATA